MFSVSSTVSYVIGMFVTWHTQTAYKKFYHKNEDIYSRSTNLMVPAIFESHSHEAERTPTEVSCLEHRTASVSQTS